MNEILATKKEENEYISETTKHNRYTAIMEEAYQYGGSLHLPELEVFGAGEVDMEAIHVFALELVDFIEKKEQEADEEELERLYHFGQSVQSEFFSASPSLINYIRLPDRLKLMTRATRSKVVQGTFGSVFVGETVYGVSFMKGRLDEITMKAMEDLSIPEKLDLLHQLRTVGAQAIANGQWSRPAYNQVRQTYETLMNSEDSTVFVQLAAEAGLETLDAEYENPQLSFIRREGQTSDSRLTTRFSNEQVEAITDKFFSKYNLDNVVSNSTRVLPATKDALVCTDRSGLAVGIIKMDVDTFLSSPDSELNFDVNQYRIYKQHLDNAEQFPAQRREEISVKIYHAIYNEYVGELVANGDIEGAAKVFAEILPVLNEEEWKTYFIGEAKQQDFPSQNALYKEAGDENAKASEESVLGLFQYREQLGERYEGDYQELEAALEHEDFEYAFEIASNITLKCQYEKEPTVIQQEVAGLQEKVRDVHRANFAKAKERFEASIVELGQTEEFKERAEVVQKIEDNLGELGDELRTLVEGKLASTKDLPQLKLTTLKELVMELKGDATLEGVTDEDILLFKHIHSSELAGKIENEFEFTLSKLSLKEQYFFLHYLKRVTPDSADVMKSFTSLCGVDGMRTFLALERFGEEFGEQIIKLGTEHSQEAGILFTHYSTLLDRASAAEAMITTAYEGEITPEVLEEVRSKMLAKADSTLKQAMADGKREGLLEAIEQSNDEAAGFGETYVALKAAGLVESVEDMKLRKQVHAGESVLQDGVLLTQIEGLYQQRYDTETATKLIQTLHTKLSLEGATITTISILDGELAASLLEVDNGERIYVGALNTSVDRGTQQLQLGTHMISSIVERKAEAGRVLDAVAVTDNAMVYTNRYKFVATKVLDTTIDGQPRLVLERDDSKAYQSSGMTIKEIKLLEPSPEGSDVLVRRMSDKNQIPSELGKGYICTKIVSDKGQLLFVLERQAMVEAELDQLSQAA